MEKFNLTKAQIASIAAVTVNEASAISILEQADKESTSIKAQSWKALSKLLTAKKVQSNFPAFKDAVIKEFNWHTGKAKDNAKTELAPQVVRTWFSRVAQALAAKVPVDTIKNCTEHGLRKEIAYHKVASVTELPATDIAKNKQYKDMDESQLLKEVSKLKDPEKFNAIAAKRKAKEGFLNTLKGLMSHLSEEQQTKQYKDFEKILNGIAKKVESSKAA